MEQDPAFVAPNEDVLDRLLVSIEASEDIFSLLIAVCDDRATRERIIQRYEQELAPHILAYRLTLNPQEPSLRAAIGEWVESHPEVVQQNRRVVLSVTGADELLWVNLRGDDPDKPPLEKFLGYLQWTREAIGQFRYPIVLWVTHRVLKLISRKAPDFWSWRKGVFRFSSEEVPNLVPQDLFSPRSLTVPQPSQFTSTQEDDFPLPLADLQDLIAKTEEQQGTESSMLATLYDRLAQAYVRRIEQGDTTDLDIDRKLAAQYFDRALQLQESFGLDSSRINTLIRFGNFYFRQGRFSESFQCYQQALEIARQTDDRQAEANSLGNLGLAYKFLGQYQQAIKFYQQSLEFQRQIGDKQGETDSLGNLGNAYYALGQYPQAIEFQQQSLEIARQIGDRRGEAISLCSLGMIYDSLGQYQQAIEFQQQSLAIQRQIGNRQGEADSLCNLGNVYDTLGQYHQAIKFHQQSLEITRQIGNRWGEASSLGNLGNAYYALGQYPQAIKFQQQHLEIARQIGDREGEANSLGNLGLAYNFLGQHQQAIEFHQQSLEIARQIGDCKGEANSLGNLGIAYKSLGQYQQAIEFQQQSLEIARQIGDKQGEAISWFNLGIVLAEVDQKFQARDAYSQAKKLYQELELENWVQECDKAIYNLGLTISATTSWVPRIEPAPRQNKSPRWLRKLWAWLQRVWQWVQQNLVGPPNS